MTRGPVHELDAGRYYAEAVNGVPMIFRADTAGAVTRIEESPFEGLELECVSCGRTDEHVYCDRWLERLRLWFARRGRGLARSTSN
jgi:hypothetical protein